MLRRYWPDDFDLIVPTAVGHRGGSRRGSGHTTIERLVDVTEQLLDERGLSSVHVAGNSLGGWMAIELARRGRARSVCALSPAGFWTPGTHDNTGATNVLIRTKRLAELSRVLAPIVTWPAFARKLMLRDIAVHGDRLSQSQTLAIVQDVVECSAAADLLGTTESVARMDILPCPITLVWAEKDRPISAVGQWSDRSTAHSRRPVRRAARRRACANDRRSSSMRRSHPLHRRYGCLGARRHCRRTAETRCTDRIHSPSVISAVALAGVVLEIEGVATVRALPHS